MTSTSLKPTNEHVAAQFSYDDITFCHMRTKCRMKLAVFLCSCDMRLCNQCYHSFVYECIKCSREMCFDCYVKHKKTCV